MPWFVSVCHACFSVLSRDQSSHLLSAFPVPSRTHSFLPCQCVFHFLEYCSSIHFHFHPCLLAQIRAYAKPSRQVQLAPLASLKIPGLLLCMVRFNRVQCKSALIYARASFVRAFFLVRSFLLNPVNAVMCSQPFTNLNDNSFWYNPTLTKIYSDPRLSIAPFVHTNKCVTQLVLFCRVRGSHNLYSVPLSLSLSLSLSFDPLASAHANSPLYTGKPFLIGAPFCIALLNFLYVSFGALALYIRTQSNFTGPRAVVSSVLIRARARRLLQDHAIRLFHVVLFGGEHVSRSGSISAKSYAESERNQQQWSHRHQQVWAVGHMVCMWTLSQATPTHSAIVFHFHSF